VELACLFYYVLLVVADLFHLDHLFKAPSDTGITLKPPEEPESDPNAPPQPGCGC